MRKCARTLKPMAGLRGAAVIWPAWGVSVLGGSMARLGGPRPRRGIGAIRRVPGMQHPLTTPGRVDNGNGDTSHSTLAIWALASWLSQSPSRRCLLTPVCPYAGHRRFASAPSEAAGCLDMPFRLDPGRCASATPGPAFARFPAWRALCRCALAAVCCRSRLRRSTFSAVRCCLRCLGPGCMVARHAGTAWRMCRQSGSEMRWLAVLHPDWHQPAPSLIRWRCRPLYPPATRAAFVTS